MRAITRALFNPLWTFQLLRGILVAACPGARVPEERAASGPLLSIGLASIKPSGYTPLTIYSIVVDSEPN